jgi:uncharacterized protein YndB with AHSA1/START domain
MTLVSTEKDVDARALTFVAEFAASPEQVWQVWADPRKLERWWGPPTVPATFTRHEFVPGGEARYHMTTPDGVQPKGWWRFGAIEEPRRIEFDYGFADDAGEPLPSEPAHGTVTFEPNGSGTRMTLVTRFPDAEVMEQVVAMGMIEGQSQAIGQIDALLVPSAV